MKRFNCSLLLLATLLTCAPAGAAPKLLHYQTKILDSNKQPLAGVVVERYRLPGFLGGAGLDLQLEERVTSDTAGSVSFTATNGGVFMLFAHKPGLSVGWSVWLPGFPAAELGGAPELVLTAPAAVAGIVQDAAGHPVPDASVWVSAASKPRNGVSWLPLNSQLGRKFLATRTGPKGEFRIEGLPDDVSLCLAVAKAGLALDQPSSPSLGEPELSFQAGDSKIVLTLKPAGALAGQVVREDTGAPIAGARISVVQNEWNDEAATARTGADGRFLLADLPPGEHRVRAIIGTAAFADWICEETSATVQAGATNRELKLSATHGGVLEVTVRHADRQPATEAIVGISRDTFNQLGIVSDQGIARFRLTPGDYQLFTFAEDCQGHQAQESVLNGQTNRVEIELESASRIAGVVLGADGKPAPHVKVTLLPFSPVEKQTDAEGRFTLTLNQLGMNTEQQHTIIARDPAHNLAATTELKEGEAAEVRLQLKPALTITGSITDAKHKAITNASAQVMFRTEQMSSTLGMPVPVDAQGRFELTALPAGGAYTVTASAKGFGQDYRSLDSNDTATNRLALAPLQLPLADRRLSGRVVDAEDKPVSGAWVNGQGERQPTLTSRSDAQGRFSFEHVCAGQLNISANTMRGQYGNVTAEAGDTNVTVQLGVARGFAGASGNGKLTGIVKDKEGKPAAKASVTLFPFTGSERPTDAEGHFKLTFNPNQWGGQQDVPRIVIARDPGRNLAAALDIEPETTNADLTLEPALTLAGRATDAQGKPLTNATVLVMLQTDRFGSSLDPSVSVDAAGRFEIKALPLDRKYTLTVSAKGFGKEQRTIEPTEPGARRVEVQKPFQLQLADQRIAGVVLDADDKPVAKASIYCYGDQQPDLNGRTDAQGRFSIDHVCAGRLNISANAPRGGYANTTAQGGDTNIVLHLESNVSRRVDAPRMARLQGKPLPELAPLGVAPADCPKDQPILALLIDAEQRPSRRTLRQLTEQAGALKLKGVTVVVLQAGGMNAEAFAAWKQEAALPFPTGCLKGEAEKARAAWGAGALPWLVLTDKNHLVIAEGFSLEELDAKLSTASK